MPSYHYCAFIISTLTEFYFPFTEDITAYKVCLTAYKVCLVIIIYHFYTIRILLYNKSVNLSKVHTYKGTLFRCDITWAVLFLMSLTLACRPEGLITCAAFKWSTGECDVHVHVASEGTVRGEGSITNLASEIPGSHVGFHMSLQYSRRHKLLVTGDASIRPLSYKIPQ